MLGVSEKVNEEELVLLVVVVVVVMMTRSQRTRTATKSPSAAKIGHSLQALLAANHVETVGAAAVALVTGSGLKTLRARA